MLTQCTQYQMKVIRMVTQIARIDQDVVDKKLTQNSPGRVKKLVG